MHKLFSIPAAAIVAVIVALITSPTPAHAADMTLYKTPGCQCCEGYADYLRENGFTVYVKPTHDLVSMSRAAGIPDRFQGCHLGVIDGYVVSGHVPVKSLKRLLTEHPNIKGITLPGMPQGSPGMTGTKTRPFTVYEIGKDRPKVFDVE